MKRFMLLIASFFAGLSLFASNYIIDDADILTQEEENVLSQKAESISSAYNFGIYIVTVPDFLDFYDIDTTSDDITINNVPNIEDCSYQYYMDKGLGTGESQDGLMLFLSMADRDFDIMAYGYGNIAFTDYGKSKLADAFLSDFSINYWCDGMEKYLSKAEYFLKWASKGHPYDYHSLAIKIENLWKNLIVSLVIGLIIAFISVKKNKRNLNNIKTAISAGNYIDDSKIALSRSVDNYLYSNTTVTYKPKPSTSSGSSYRGGTSVHSNGSSHHSGKF